jgi:hypothetical protein
VAEANGLKVVNGRVALPDLRIEYEIQGQRAWVDLELATHNYRGAHLRSKAGAGFKVYIDSSRPGSPVFDHHDLLGEIFAL